MTIRNFLILVYFYLLTSFSTATADDYIPYHEISLEGWTTFIEKKLVDTNDKRVFKTLRILSRKLQEVKQLIPEKHLPQLQKIPIWISENTGGLAEFYFFEDSVYRYERNPKKIGGIEFQNINLFLEYIEEIPMLVIHELAHAYHKQNFERIDKLIMQAYKNANWEKRYKDVRLGRSLHRETMYASTTPFEYFAELSESYFGYNDSYPHTADELKKHDPEGYKMVEEAWQ